VKRTLLVGALSALAIFAAAAAAGRALYRMYPAQVSVFVALTRNTIRSWGAPPGETTTEVNAAFKSAPVPLPTLSTARAEDVIGGDWPSYNRTLTSERFSPLSEINAKTVGKLKLLCTYDTKQYTSFEPGLIMVNGALIGTTLTDIFSINPATCEENWRTREDLPASILSAMRGAAYLDGMLFRGSQDGWVLAYDFKTGKQIWQTAIADTTRGEFVAAAPIAWNGLVFIGDAGGDAKGGKGRMYALNAKTGKIEWEFYLIPKTESDRNPRTSRPLSAQCVDLEQRARLPDQRRRDLDIVHARSRSRRIIRARR
jgi:alcohol dehydrogenase (cytochrome c)